MYNHYTNHANISSQTIIRSKIMHSLKIGSGVNNDMLINKVYFIRVRSDITKIIHTYQNNLQEKQKMAVLLVILGILFLLGTNS